MRKTGASTVMKGKLLERPELLLTLTLSLTLSLFFSQLSLFSHQHTLSSLTLLLCSLTLSPTAAHSLTVSLPPLTLLSRSHSLCDLSPSHRFNFFFTVSKKIKLGENSQNLGLRKSKVSIIVFYSIFSLKSLL
ncbi:hypothetical protein QL285_006772 [Trifolium repens]|nr:hypothetical protein QL285_006772 [Trifolium repens]